jgi:hypothetical protein
MAKKASILGRAAAASGLALLLSAPALVVNAQYYNNQPYAYQNNNGHVTIEGRITSMIRRGSSYDVTLDNGGSTYRVPRSSVTRQNLQIGTYVRLDGYQNNRGVVRVDDVLLPNDANWNYNRGMTSSSSYNAPGANYMTGTVENVNRHYNYVTIRDANTGQRIKVDVRRMDTRRSINVWQLRPGQRIAVNGGWENADTFQATNINF